MHRHMPPMRFVERLQRVNANPLKLRSNQHLKKVGTNAIDAFSQDYATVTLIDVGKLRDDIAFDYRRTGSRNMLSDPLSFDIHEFQALPVSRTVIRAVKTRSQFAAADYEKSAIRCRRGYEPPQ